MLNFQTRSKLHSEQCNLFSKLSVLALAGAGGIEPYNNPLTHKDFSLATRLLDSIFDSKAPAATLPSL